MGDISAKKIVVQHQTGEMSKASDLRSETTRKQITAEVEIMEVSQVKKLGGNGATEIILHHVKMEQMGEVGEALSWNWTMKTIGRDVEQGQGGYMKEGSEEMGRKQQRWWGILG